jgi:tetratricopeptide (TPR) repeat protein
MSAFPLRRSLLNLRARYHLWSGRRAYRLGRMRTAGRHFQEALHYGYESYEAYLLLGKISYREHDMQRAALFFSRARSADPSRFLVEGFPDDFIETLLSDRRRAGAARPEYRIVIESTRPRKLARGTAKAPAARPAKLGDFASRDEMLRHRERPALRPGEGTDVDWDDEARKLFGE